jgi:PIN domain nuclease of toxin-antitoxin system
LVMKYVVDTHALIWFLEGNPRLGASAKTVLMDPISELILPAIALAEAVWIVDRGKTSIPSVKSLLDLTILRTVFSAWNHRMARISILWHHFIQVWQKANLNKML